MLDIKWFDERGSHGAARNTRSPQAPHEDWRDVPIAHQVSTGQEFSGSTGEGLSTSGDLPLLRAPREQPASMRSHGAFDSRSRRPSISSAPVLSDEGRRPWHLLPNPRWGSSNGGAKDRAIALRWQPPTWQPSYISDSKHKRVLFSNCLCPEVVLACRDRENTTAQFQTMRETLASLCFWHAQLKVFELRGNNWKPLAMHVSWVSVAEGL